MGGARGDPYPIDGMLLRPPIPDPRRDPPAAAAAHAAAAILEQNEMLDLRRELWRSNVFWAEKGDGRTR